MQKFWDDLASLPPAAVTGLYLALCALPWLGVSDGEIVTFNSAYGYLSISSPSIWMVVPPLFGVWYYALYRACVARTFGAILVRPSASLVSLIAYVAFVIAAAFLYEQRHSPPDWLVAFVTIAIGIAVLGFFVSVWSAAAALVNAERPMSRRNSTVGTFLLVFYLPIGIWFLDGRIKSMLLRAPTIRNSA